jgi:hypothetical protein
MAGKEEKRDPLWGNSIARITFIGTMIYAALFVAAALFIILRGGL